ncbi:MAG: glutamate racemase [Candidatus Methylacidiphilales bacterium]
MSDSRPLGVFDSGVGGLTVVRALNRLLPGESIIYLGDTARVPYGNKSPEAIRRYAREDAFFLTERGVKAVVIACNTASAHALETVSGAMDVPVLGVIKPGVEAALERSESGRIGIMGTAGTIASGAYQDGIRARRPDAHIVARSTPLLVPLIEEGWLDHKACKLVVQEYLCPFLEANTDTLVLACTHYPLIRPLLEEMAGSRMEMVDSAGTCAQEVRRVLGERGLLSDAAEGGHIQACLTDYSPHFQSLAERFLDRPLMEIERVNVDGG